MPTLITRTETSNTELPQESPFEKYRLAKPIQVIVESVGDRFAAAPKDQQAFGFFVKETAGATESEAKHKLLESIIRHFEALGYLSQRARDLLGENLGLSGYYHELQEYLKRR